MTSTIDWTQPIETDETSPRPVRVLVTDLDESVMPVVIKIYNEAHVRPCSLSGVTSIAYGGKPITLRNVAPKPVVEMFERWVNLYPNGSSGVIHSSKDDADNTTLGGRRIDCRRIAWTSDGSPVDSELLPEYLAMESDRDQWKAKAEVLQAELKTFYCDCGQSLLTGHHEDGCPHDKPVSDWRQSEMERMRHVVDAAVAGVDSFNRRGLLRLIEAVRAYQTQPCPTCEGGMIYLKRTQCPDCNGTGKKVNTR